MTLGFHDILGGTFGLSQWRGHPDDDAAHAMILGWLQNYATTGFLDADEILSPQRKGNLGEFIAYRIGRTFAFPYVPIAPAANAGNPLAGNSVSGIDIVWLNIGDSVSDDWAGVQEVKTTGERLSITRDLIADYNKLFGRHPYFTLHARLDELKHKLEQFGRDDLIWRVDALGGPEPRLAGGVKLFPTLVHDLKEDSKDQMILVRQALLAKGWSTDVVTGWSIALDNLDHRLERMAKGQP